MSAESGRDRHAAYGASKAALIGLTKNLAVELAPSVRVNCICPGATVTPMLQEFLATYYGPNPSEELTQTMLADAKRLPWVAPPSRPRSPPPRSTSPSTRLR